MNSWFDIASSETRHLQKTTTHTHIYSIELYQLDPYWYDANSCVTNVQNWQIVLFFQETFSNLFIMLMILTALVTNKITCFIYRWHRHIVFFLSLSIKYCLDHGPKKRLRFKKKLICQTTYSHSISLMHTFLRCGCPQSREKSLVSKGLSKQ